MRERQRENDELSFASSMLVAHSHMIANERIAVSVSIENKTKLTK